MYTTSEARASLATLLDEVERGEEVTITRHGRPAARLIGPLESSSRTMDILHASGQIAIELDRARSRPLSAAVHDGRSADELVAALRAERDSW